MSIYTIKELETPDTPLLLFECALPDGTTERWATHQATVEGHVYSARVLSHNLFELKAASEEGADGIAKVSLTLANADSRFSQIERNGGIKGAKLTVRFAFYDLRADAATTGTTVLFRGSANPPEECTESRFRVSFTNRLNMQRMSLPPVRIQRRCPWIFPKTAAQRAEAVSGLDAGKYSPYFRCGYSPDQEGGAGSMNGSVPFADCNFTRRDCEQRGMFSVDGAGRTTRRFGGIEFVPASTLVRGFGEAGHRASAALENTGRYNDFVPAVYGTAWYQPPIVFAKNDGNLTRMEVLLGIGEIRGVLKVLVNGYEIPLGQSGQNMTATGWFNVVSLGNRTGAFNAEYVSATGQALGDPYGSMAYIAVAVPNRISDGRSLPKIEALIEGLKVSVFSEEGNYTGEEFSNNPAWVLLDVLRRCGWGLDEIDLASFGRTAGYCAADVSTTDLNGNAITIPRYQTNLVLRRRRSAAEVVRGIRTSAALYLAYSAEGKLTLKAESALSVQQPVKPAGSNSTAAIGAGWPAYEFGDGTNGFGGILRRENGEPTLQVFSRSTADTPNRVSVEFQDSFNEYQQDSVSLIDPEDVVRAGQEVASTLLAEGLPNIDQAIRIARLSLHKSIRGNTYVEFDTSVRGLGLRPGDLITLSYLKEGFDRQLFRVTRVAPNTNYRTATITAQIHDDVWYTGGAVSGFGQRRRGGAEIGIPRPLAGKTIDAQGRTQYLIAESAASSVDGSSTVSLTAEFAPPGNPALSRATIPILSLTPTVLAAGGTLSGGQTLYYAVSGVDADGAEGEASFVVRATILAGTTNSIRLNSLSFNAGTTGFHVYRGRNPQQLQRIASSVPVTAVFVDTGFAAESATPPDASYDHANFYWRLERLPETAATVFSGTTIGSSALSLQTNEFAGGAVRITLGKGAGQERQIFANDSTTVAVGPPWSIVPDSTSAFVVADAAWQLGATTRTDRAVFPVPNRRDAIVQTIGRSANVRGEESAEELAPLTRWTIGGNAGASLDAEIAPEPFFGLFTAGDGAVELLSVSFADLTNTRSVSAGTLTLHYWNELASPSPFTLATAMSAVATAIDLSSAGSAQAGDFVQIGAEIVEVEEVLNGGTRYKVLRGAFETNTAAHAAGTRVYHLARHVAVIPFVRDFFGSPASGSFGYPVWLGEARIAAAELFVTNSQGASPVAKRSYTATVDQGLRTLAGGQLSFQVDGYLAIQSSPTAPLVTDAPRAIRDIFANVREAPVGAPVLLRVLRDGTAYCDLTVPAGATVSNSVSGFGLPALAEKTKLTVDILSVPPSSVGTPGRDLTVTLRY
ncbi:MAG: phage tail protein [Bryobacteraceae bacterium]|nr:phage tail protein [Bryobacteraceae bacterium]